MNPLDLRGPEFLGFYIVFAAIVLLVTWIVRTALDAGGAPPRVSDPYALALLRGGRAEAVKTALLSLSERGVVNVSGAFAVADAASGQRVRAGLEAAVARRFDRRGLVVAATSDPGVVRELTTIERRLQSQGLLPDAGANVRRALVLVAAELLLVGMAAAKIVVAIQRGRSNVLFLVILAFAAAFIAVKVALPRTTPRAKRLLAELRTLLAPLHSRSLKSAARKSASWADDVAMIAAVYGPNMVPYGTAAKLALWPPPPPSTSSSGSTWISSCGSSCGGGCGGGGCGGCGS